MHSCKMIGNLTRNKNGSFKKKVEPFFFSRSYIDFTFLKLFENISIMEIPCESEIILIRFRISSLQISEPYIKMFFRSKLIKEWYMQVFLLSVFESIHHTTRLRIWIFMYTIEIKGWWSYWRSVLCNVVITGGKDTRGNGEDRSFVAICLAQERSRRNRRSNRSQQATSWSVFYQNIVNFIFT